MNTEFNNLAQHKNNLYRNAYRRTVGLLIMMALVTLGLSTLLGYMIITEKKADYYASTTTGNVVPLDTLSMPVITTKYLLQWAKTVARSTYNIDFVHYDKQINNAKPYFSNEGWEKMQAALKSSGLIDSITKNKLFASAIVDGPVVINNRYVLAGRYTWEVQVPLLVTYTSASETSKKHYTISMTIMRMPVLEVEKGIAVNDFKVH
jgi:intracellular multiplication protein IcmL